MTITLRQESDARASTKGTSLTFQELDNNFIDILNRTEFTVEGDSGNAQLSSAATDDRRLVINGAGGLTTSVTSDSTGQAVLTLTQGASAADFQEGVQPGTNIDVTADSTGQVTVSLEPIVDNIELKDYKETIHALGSTDTPTLTVSNGNVQSVTISSGLTLPEFTDAEPGHTITLIVSGSGTVSGSTSSAGNAYVFAGGNTTLTTSSIISILFDGVKYYASVATDFQ
jgi:hypothetical protein